MGTDNEMLDIPEEIFLRPIKCELNLLSKPDGSAMLAQGKTVVLAAVYGPDESKLNRLQVDKVSFDAIFQSKSGPNVELSTPYESLIKAACTETLFPKVYARNDITLIVQELQNRGSMLACAINAGCLALINTGLEMKCLVGAVTCMINQDGEISTDPDEEASENAKALITLAFDSLSYSIVISDCTGSYTAPQYLQVVKLSKEIVKKKIIPFYRSVVEKYARCI